MGTLCGTTSDRLKMILMSCSLVLLLVFSLFAQAFAAQRPFQEVYDMKTDPVTSYYGDHFENNTLEDGRIWTDKSVTTNGITYYDEERRPLASVNVEPDEFLITLSALSQSYNVFQAQVPVDTVFAIDISSSMSAYGMSGNTNAPAGQTRDYLLVTALNSAIAKIMNDNPQNRVAVVAYSGTNTYPLLSLNHYDLDTGEYFAITTSGSTHYLDVDNALLGGGNTMARVAVSGGTNTQMGIATGAQILTNNADTEYTYTTPEGQEFISTRKPIMILMTDGDPTYGWLDYAMQGTTGSNYTAGNGNPGAGDIGTDLTTILTASYWKDRIRDHYYPDHGHDPVIYTLGVGVNGVHAPAVLDPANNAAANSYTHSGTTYNLKTLLDDFISTDSSAPQISFPMNTRGSNTIWQLVTLTNSNHEIRSYEYTDGYYDADSEDSLNAAFESIARNIITKGSYATLPGADPSFSGYLAIADPLGEYMEFRSSKGVFIDGELWQGDEFARLLSAGPTLPDGSENEGYIEYETTFASTLGVSRTVSRSIIESCRMSGAISYADENNYSAHLRWYSDSSMQYVGDYYDDEGKELAVPDGATCKIDLLGWYIHASDYITSQPVNLLSTYTLIATALEEGTFSLRDSGVSMSLIEGQQLIRWYLPAALIPMRSVALQQNPENPSDTEFVVDHILPIKLSYAIGLQKGFDPDDVSETYKANHATPDGKGYYFYANDWAGARDDDSYDQATVYFTPNDKNPYYTYLEDTDLYILQGDDYVLATEESEMASYYTIETYFDYTVEGYLATTYLPVDRSITEISLRPDGTPYVQAGQDKSHPARKVLKTENVTETNEYVKDTATECRVIDHTHTHGYFLGNNGRLELRDFAPLTVEKKWEGEELEDIWVQLYRNGTPYRTPIRLSPFNDWRAIFNMLLAFETTADEDGNTNSYTYTIAEGTYADATFTPYGEAHPLEGYEISYTQPVWNQDFTVLSGAEILNVQDGLDPGDPEDPEDPTEPEDPGDPGDSTNPPNPDDPRNPIDPTDPGNSGDPSRPTTPTETPPSGKDAPQIPWTKDETTILAPIVLSIIAMGFIYLALLKKLRSND